MAPRQDDIHCLIKPSQSALRVSEEGGGWMRRGKKGGGNRAPAPREGDEQQQRQVHREVDAWSQRTVSYLPNNTLSLAI